MVLSSKQGQSPEGYDVEAATDDLGSHVIVVGRDVHLISQYQEGHSGAVALAQRVAAEGIGVYDDWIDIKAEGDGGLGRVMMGIFQRAQQVDAAAEDYGDEVISESESLVDYPPGYPPPMPW